MLSICVFCGASMGKHPIYEESAHTLGTELAARGLTLVYGGGSIGLMGAIARAADAGGAPIVSILPKSLEQVESVGQSFGEVIVIDSLAERKELMGQRSDAFIAMPGGFGTLDELIEMITWSQLGVHAKPVGLLNVNGFYDPFMAMIEHHLAEGFIQERHRQLFVADEKPDVLLDKLAAQVIPESLIQW